MTEQIVTVIGTLGAALLGFIGILLTNQQNNRSAIALEKQKYEQEALRQTREKRMALLEEFSSLYFKLNRGRYIHLGKLDKDGLPIFPLSETVNRTSVIVILYFDELQPIFFVYSEAHSALQALYRDMDTLLQRINSDTISEDDTERARTIEAKLSGAKAKFDAASGNLLLAIKQQSEALHEEGITNTPQHRFPSRRPSLFKKWQRKLRGKLYRLKLEQHRTAALTRHQSKQEKPQ